MTDNLELLDASDCWSHLRRSTVGRVATVVDGRVAIRPVNFAVDHGTLLVRTGRGSWLSHLPGLEVVFETDGTEPGEGSAPLAAWSVILECTAKSVSAAEELVDTVGVPVFPWHESPKPVFVRLEPTTITGRRFPVADSSVWTTSLDTSRKSSEE